MTYPHLSGPTINSQTQPLAASFPIVESSMSSAAEHDSHPVPSVDEAAIPFSDEQRLLLNQFGDKFSRYASSFSPQVIQNYLKFYHAVYKQLASVTPDIVAKEAGDRFKAPAPAIRVFLHKALARFEVWLDKVIANRKSAAPFSVEEVPPLDVLSILHAYLLSPWGFDEDMSYHVPTLSKLPEFPLDHMKDLVNSEADFIASETQIRSWETATGLPFQIEADNHLPQVTCPRCDELNVVAWTQTTTPSATGTGYAEKGFNHTCTKCQFNITTSALCMKKLVNDLIAVQGSDQAFLACTVLRGNGDADTKAGSAIAAEVVKSLGDPTDHLGDKLSWDMGEARRRIFEDSSSRIQKTKIDRLLGPYMQPSRFSVDLVYKAFSQGGFAQKSENRGMYRTAILQGSETNELVEGIFAYRSFIKLQLLPNLPKVSPTYIVDLVWHTHQLQSHNYKAQMQDMIGIFLNHRSIDLHAPVAPEPWRNTMAAAGLDNALSIGAPPRPPPIRTTQLTGGSNTPEPPTSPPDCDFCEAAARVPAEGSILPLEMLDDVNDALRGSQAPPSVKQLSDFLRQ
ncbi:hypothetical protein DL93DRAFT_2076984 [Clavulina sp. PMI_390]|nr:hypothetical protein DL93DRAFT_2076984 [Clavulina sp. PMI_390]